jgi:hypothetical protein
MKKTKLYVSAAFWLAICTAWLIMPSVSPAQVVLGSFQSSGDPTDAGWIDTQNSDPITSDPNASFVAAGVPGYANSLQMTGAGTFGNPSSLELQLTTAQIEALLTNSYLTFTFSVPPGSATAGYNQIANLQFQFWQAGGAATYGATNWPWANAQAQGDTANNQSGDPNYYFPYSGNPAIVNQTVTVNYSGLTNAIVAGLNSGNFYLNILFQGNTGGGSPAIQDFNNVVLSTGPFGQPLQTSVVYTEDDFSTNGVAPTNPAGDDYYAAGAFPYNVPGNIDNVWSEWFGNGGPGASAPGINFNPNVNVSGNTNANGAMELDFTWTAASDGYQQWLLWHGNGNTYVPQVAGGAVGIGWPTYTNVSCDVKFDPSSAGTTNNQGVLGVIRIGVRPVGGFGQDWITYTTISDTNWHHLNAPLTSSDVNAGNIADFLIGEDVHFSLGNGNSNALTGNQILYVDNVKFNGPLVTVAPPPPTMGTPTRATPGLRMFAGPTSTDDRTIVYTYDQMQSWVNATPASPVSYSFSLQDYNPNIAQIMVELMGGGETPTSNNEFDDFSGPTTMWLTINPGPAGTGEVVANVQWKVNDPGANPNNTALSFTNSTGIGAWTLVFTGPTNGFVVAPGHVILGPTSFVIADATAVSDFGNPVFAAIGEQPNTGAGQGAYEDFGYIGITNVVDGNEYENFTTEGSDFAQNFTPSGLFNNSISQLPATAIIQTTNDAWWINWTQPAVGFTLSSTTNLKSTNWINPGWYSGYSDTNAPRVMPLPQSFAGKFWVLLPQDDVPTANGHQNTYTGSNGGPGPASTPPAPYTFFRAATNTFSP